jgi:iron complex transport system substrate-binding protein
LDVDNSTSGQIDDVVRHHSAKGEAIYKLDSEVISKLRPDLIIAQDHCRVCAITPEDMQSSEACLNIPQLIVRPSTLEDCLENVETVAGGLGYPQRGKLLRQTLEYQMSRVKQVVGATVSSKKRPKVALLEWCDPIMGCGYWLPELVKVAGGEPLHCPPPGGATPNISFSQLIDSKPHCVIFALCGFGLTRAAKELVQSWGHPKLQQLQDSCKRVFVVDGNYLINRSGPRVVESAEALAEAIHPELQGHFGHFGTDFLTTLEGALALVDAGMETGSTKSGRPKPFPTKQSREDSGESSRTGLTPPTNTADETVAKQLEHLRRNEYLFAFAINSTANQARWCSPDRFVSILQTHPSFRRLLTEPASIGKVESNQSNIATVRVTLPKTENQSTVVLVWTMVAESTAEDIVSWRTEKVGIFSQ